MAEVEHYPLSLNDRHMDNHDKNKQEQKGQGDTKILDEQKKREEKEKSQHNKEADKIGNFES